MTTRQIKSRKQLEEMKRLYEQKGWDLRRIGDHFGISHQAVHERLVNAGVKMRSKGGSKKRIDRETLEKFFIKEKLTLKEICGKLGTTWHVISRELDRHNIKTGCGERYQTKYDGLGKLQIGEKMLTHRTKGKRPHTVLYDVAKRFGIKVSVKTVDEKTLQVTRVK